jgi:iron complex transport system ATP-binding protein
MTLAVHNLTIKLGKSEVLRDLSASFAPGTVSVILGPNGAGKTSLIRALAGLILGTVPSGTVPGMDKGDSPEGRFLCGVNLDGRPLSTIPPSERARRIGYLPQDVAPAWDVTVRDLVSLGRLPHRRRLSAPSEADEAAVSAALTATDISAFAARTLGALSGGERARVMLARVIAGAPDWLIADEPLANLDPAHQLDVLALLRAEAARGTGVVAVLHDLTLAARVADQIVLLRDGRLIASGTVRETLTADALAQAFGVEVHIGTTPDGAPLIMPLARDG